MSLEGNEGRCGWIETFAFNCHVYRIRIYCGSYIGVLEAVKPLGMGLVWCFGLGSLMSVALHLVHGSRGVFAGWNACF